MSIRVLLLDEQPITLRGLEELFQGQPDMLVAGRARTAADALQLLQSERPDVLVFDLPQPRARAVALLRALQGYPSTHLVLLTATTQHDLLRDAVRRGVQAIVLKDMAPERLLAAVREAVDGAQTVMPELAPASRVSSPEGSAATLTPRERDVARLVADGLRNREIAIRLGIKEDTVKMHLRHVYDKLALRNRVELAQFVRKHGV